MSKTLFEDLASHKSLLVKQHIEFDLQGRTWKMFTAVTTAKHGDQCEVTEYRYPNLTTTQIVGRKEGIATWDSAWDADFTIGDI